MKHILTIILASLFAVSCSTVGETKNETYKFTDIDPSINPGDDFFNHVNKTWMDNAVIADDQVGVGAYRFLNIPQQEKLKNILEEVSQNEHPNGSVEQLVGDFYASGMDTVTINKLGAEPIKPLLNRIDAIETTEQLLAFVTNQITVGDYSMLSAYVSADQKNSTNNILHLSQTGLGLPDRDYYFKEDPSVSKIQAAYKTYLENIFELVGELETAKKAAVVYKIEKELAQSHKTRIQRRVIRENYHKMAVFDLDKSHDNINWVSVFETLGADIDSLNVAQPAYYDTLNKMLKSTSIDDWKLYLKANSIGTYASILSTPFQDVSFEYSKVLSGQSVQQSRTKQMVHRVDRQIGFALGQLYVKRYFNEEAKNRALDLVNNFQLALEVRIDNLEWMSDSTKVKAKEKLFAINKKIGYPDVWRTYNVTIERDDFFKNIVSLNKDAYQYELNQLNKVPNRDEWHTTPSTVTAYYNPSLNEIVFPAGILQAPYFDLSADDALNYGGIGMVIGHEFTHAFDDQGAQYDKNGNVSNWWAESDYTKFKEKTQQIIDQYSSFTVLDSVHLKGALTVGENTADNGGIAIAFDAFKMTDQGKGLKEIDGFTPNQRFFLSVANIWKVKTRDEYLRNYVATDPHSPPIWRVNGPLMNFTPFYEAFDVKPGEANYKTEEERIMIW
ncbi:M13 family metallopeptidase [Urechidicola vernalis]|uniref:M13 family metallopeptidase n=1 Tax=Urechidicola vernalis TaxID=3075600 RepID=A0ABU2Y4J7_9FLAO|nr:M13 family metallopeptidase [Urechidicola sp. P050]MDT0551983.1 M13 family metallopeptidase [Urechidicola sp. P050]